LLIFDNWQGGVMDRATIVILLVLLFALGLYGYRLARGERGETDDEVDTGSAILDFARAFPGEAIRSLHMTADHEAVFVRLHDSRSGFMRNMGNHHACLLLDAKTLTVVPLASGDGLHVTFEEWPKFTGEYRFATQEEAAEVSLWLLASLQADGVTDQSVEDEATADAVEGDADEALLEDDANLDDDQDDPLAGFTSGPDK
jgi:hypothetical protein